MSLMQSFFEEIMSKIDECRVSEVGYTKVKLSIR